MIVDGFLVNLGFNVDQAGMARYSGALQVAEKKVAELSRKAVAGALAMGAAWLKASESLAKDHFTAKYVNSSVSGLKAVQQAFQDVGGDAGMAAQAMGTITKRMRESPGYAEQFKNLLGVSLRDTTGKARDMSDVMAEAADALRGMSDEQAAAYASALGLGDAWVYMKQADFSKSLRDTKKELGEVGDELDENSESTANFWKSLQRLWNTLKIGAMYVVGYLNKLFDLDGLVTKLDNWLRGGGIKMIAEGLGAIAKTAMRIFNGGGGPLDMIKRMTHADDIFKEEYGKLQERDEEVAKARKAAGEGSHIAGGGSIDAKPPAGSSVYQPASPAETSAQGFSSHKSNAARYAYNFGNVRPTDGKGFMKYSTAGEGIEAMGKQLVRYYNSGARTLWDIINTWAPKKDKNNPSLYMKVVAQYMSKILGQKVGTLTGLDLKDPRVLQSLMAGMTIMEHGHGNEDWINDPAAYSHIAAAARFKGLSTAIKKENLSRVENNLNLSQVINVDSKNAANAIANETERRLNARGLGRNTA